MRALRASYSSHRLIITTRRCCFTSAPCITILKSYQNHHALQNCRIVHSTSIRFCEESTPQSVGAKRWGDLIHKNDVTRTQELGTSRVNHAENSEEGSVGNIESVGNVNVVGGIRNVRGCKKSKILWVCINCGHSDGQWWGVCQSCKMAGTLKQFGAGDSISGGAVNGFNVSGDIIRSWVRQHEPVKLSDVKRGSSEMEWRIPLGGLLGKEVDRVLGGGVVPGSLILIGGDPGIGKSTLFLQIAALLTESSSFRESAPVLYVSGEESVEQIASRADRINVVTENLFLYSCTDMKEILGRIQHLSPRALIIDSVQTIYLNGVTGSVGGLMQVKECTSALQHFAKNTNIPVFVIGHLTKTGDIAGPHVMEHIVDVVLYMEGQKDSSRRLLRSVKNRFGSTDELGIFEMSPTGLLSVLNPCEHFLSEHQPESEVLAGVAVAVIMHGSMTFLIEIQALCVSDADVTTHFNGIQRSRAEMIISVLMKQIGIKITKVFLNVVGGASLSETSGDVAMAAAICSSFFEFPLPNSIAFIGEIGLAGELRSVPGMEKRIRTVAKLGYHKCIIPKSAEKILGVGEFGKTEIVGCGTVKEVIDTVFRGNMLKKTSLD